MDEVEKGPIGFFTRLDSPLLFFPSPISPPCLQCNAEGPQPPVATAVVIPVFKNQNIHYSKDKRQLAVHTI